MKDVADQFSNYPAFCYHFVPVVIEKVGRNEYIVYHESDPESWLQRGTKEYIEGWLYGAVQTVCGQIVRRN